MGIDLASAVLLADAMKNNICFDKILTIGHQKLYLAQNDIAKLARKNGLEYHTKTPIERQFADEYFRIFLGSNNVMSLDYSDYEGCDIIHDMNCPIDSRYHEQFDAVIDGGSLEHIFNFPVAIMNCMKMIKKGGSIFIFTVANNYLGHGFYQFSPELFYRIFQQENGFEIRNVILAKHPFLGVDSSFGIKYYSVVDPIKIQERVGLVSNSPVTTMIHAVRTEIRTIFKEYPIQSDYLIKYGRNNGDNYVQSSNNAFRVSLKSIVKKYINYLPLSIKLIVLGNLDLLRFSFYNKHIYKRWYPS